MWNLKKTKTKNPHQTKLRLLVVVRGRQWGMGELGERDQKVSISSYKIIIHRDIIYGMVAIDNNTVLCI